MSSFVVDGLGDWLVGLDQTYEDGLSIGLEELFRTFHQLVMFRTPRDDVSEQGKAKSFNEHLQQQWEFALDDNRWGATIGTDADYASTLEEGLYKGIGARTVAGPQGIFSRQAPQGIIGPLVSDEKLIEQHLQSIIAQLDQHIEALAKKK